MDTSECSSKINFEKNLSVQRKSFIIALSKGGLKCGNNFSLGFYTHIELTGSSKNIGKGMKIATI